MTATVQEILTGEMRCMLCGRTAATARVTNGRAHATVTRPEHAEVVRRMRCPSCGGNLQIVDTAHEVIRTFHLTPADLVPKRGPKPKAINGAVS